MQRALVLAGETARRSGLARNAQVAHGLSLVFEHPDLVVLAQGFEVRTFSDGEGVLLGEVFSRHPLGQRGPQQVTLPSGSCISDYLLATIWGDYLACVVRGGRARLLRSPFGQICAYYIQRAGLLAMVTDPGLGRALGLIVPRLDEEFVAHQLVFPQLRLQKTGDVETSELLAGQELDLSSRGHNPRTAWSPWKFAGRRHRITDMEEASASLRLAINGCVAALTQGVDRAALRLSGGLDSSIVGAALSKTPTWVAAVNLRTPGRDGDERSYAEAAARDFAMELHTVAPEPGAWKASEEWSLRPNASDMLGQLNHALSQVAAQLGVQAVFTGAGGDNVFALLNSAAPAGDRLRAQGPGPGFWRTVQAVAGISGTTSWRVARAAVAPRRRANHWSPDLRFVRRESVCDVAGRHPWLVQPPGAPRGAITHVRALLAVQNHLHPQLDAAALIHPLLSQPVVETCLQVASWLWVEGGRDRAVARRAFSHQLPQPVLARRGKGRLDSYAAPYFTHSRLLLEEQLRHGDLARRGFIDVEAIGRYLRQPGAPRDQDFYRIMELADLDAWIATWLE